jgi:hypothetical protein
MITWLRYASLNQKWLLALILVSMVAIAVDALRYAVLQNQHRRTGG